MPLKPAQTNSVVERPPELHFNLNENFLPPEFYLNLQNEDQSLLTVQILGLKLANKSKFTSFFSQLIQLIGDEGSSTKAKLKCIQVIRNLISYSREKEFEIVEDVINLGLVEVLCDGIKLYSKEPTIAINFIELSVDLLEEEERWIQDKFYEYMV